MDTKEKFAKSRSLLVMGWPFWGFQALQLDMQADPKSSGVSINGKSLSFNPEYVEEHSIRQITGKIAECIDAMAKNHHTRRGVRDFERWQKASDYQVRPDLSRAGFEVEDIRWEFDNMSVEQVYQKLEDEEQNQPQSDSQGGQGHTGGSDVDDFPAKSPDEREAHEKEVKMRVIQAAEIQKNQGDLPGYIKALLDDYTNPKTPWQDVLKRFMTENLKDRYDWTRPNRRYIAQGIYMPSRRMDAGMGTMAIFADSSGSMSDDDLAKCLSHVNMIKAVVKPQKVVAMACDTRVHFYEEFGEMEDVKISLDAGRGGTCFKPPFRELKKRGIVPACAVYFTDMCGDFPKNPGFPVLWARTDPEYPDAPWGEVVDIDMSMLRSE